MKNSESTFLAILFFFILNFSFEIRNLSANELSVDKRTLQLDDTLTITVSLDGSFAGLDSIRVPVQNLVIDGAPSVSSEFQWINGQTSHRKIFRYSAHPRGPGAALVGPLTLHGSGGEVETLAPVSVQVLPDTTAASNDPVKIMHELIATRREPIFLVAQADKSEVFEGEEVVVTWTLYNGATVQQYALGEIPKLEDFWSEELGGRGEPQQVMLGGMVAEKMIVRRVALFPLRSGTLTVGPMTVHASIMKRVSAGDPFGLFEGVLVDVSRRSAPLRITARPIPPGAPVGGVGMINLQCHPPSQTNGGPVALDVTVSGRANLRAMQPPQWQSEVDGTTRVIERGVSVFPVNYDAWMTRKWRYLVFPSHSGSFLLPALTATILTPAGDRREIRCEAKTLQVSAASPTESHAPAAVRRLRRPSIGPSMLIAAAVLAIALLSLPRARNRLRLRRQLLSLLRDTPAETRAAVDDALAARGFDPLILVREASDRGDAYRAFRSLIDAAERDRIAATPREISHRIRDVLIATGGTVQSARDHDAASRPAPLHGG